MAGFDFNQVDQFVQESDNKITFLKLQDDGWYAKVRFMYGPNEMFRGETVHNISEDPTKPRYVSCLREEGQPIEVCPLCANGSKLAAQFFIPVYVQSIVSVVRGIEQEQQVGQVMIFQRGATFKGALQSVIRQTSTTGKPIVSSMFRLVRNGKAKDPKTNYTVEYMGTDDVTLDQLPERPIVIGSYILPKPSYDEMMEKYVNGVAQQQATKPADIQPRTLSANTFAGNNLGFGQPAPQATPQVAPVPSFNQPMNNANQAPVQAPTIGTTSGNLPF